MLDVVLEAVSSGGTVCLPAWLLGLIVSGAGGYGVAERYLRVREREQEQRDGVEGGE